MLNDLDDGGGVEAFQPLVAVHQGAVEQLHALGLLGRQPLQLQPPLGHFQRADRHVQADDLLELLLLEQLADQLAFAAAKIEDALGARSP